MKNAAHFYIKKGNEGYDFFRGYIYDHVDGKYQAVGNKFSATKTVLYGATWSESSVSFDTAEEGNNVYSDLIQNQGFEICSREEYDELRPWD